MTGVVFYSSNRLGRAVRLPSLRLCNSCIINLLPNGFLRMDFFFLGQFVLSEEHRSESQRKTFASYIFLSKEPFVSVIVVKRSGAIMRHLNGECNIFPPEVAQIQPSSPDSFKYTPVVN